MVGFIPGAQPTKHLNSCLNTRLTNKYRLKAPLQSLILLNELTVFVQSGGADTLQLTVSQRWFKHITGINSSLSRPSPDYSMHLINEQYYFALCLPNLIHHRLKPLLKLTSELAPCHQCPHIQSHYLAPLKGIGNIVSHNLLCQPLSNGSLAHPGIANNHRVILGPPGKYLHHPANLIVPTDNRVELALTGKLSQVTTILLQGAIFALRPGISNPVPAAKLLQSLKYLLLVNTKPMQNISHPTLLLPSHGN